MCCLILTMESEITKKRRQFTVQEKLKILNAIDGGGRKKRDIAKDFNIPSSTLSTILKRRAKIEETAKKCAGLQQKKMRGAMYNDIDEAVYLWCKDLDARKIPISGPEIRKKALELAYIFGHEEFLASVGWLNRFRVRYGITLKSVYGELNLYDVRNSLIHEYEERITVIQNMISFYNPDDVFNAGKTEIFYQLLPQHVMVSKENTCKEERKLKYLTILFCVNASGTEKNRLWIIGNSTERHCFRNVQSIPCEYRTNKCAWITQKLFEEWLLDFNSKMVQENRKVLLLIDSTTAQNSLLKLDCVRIEFLPQSSTADLKPLDQGIIRSVKSSYRIRMLKQILLGLANSQKIDLKRAIYMIVGAWHGVAKSKIVKCWEKTGLVPPSVDSNDRDFHDMKVDAATDSLWEAVLQKTGISEKIIFKDYIDADNSMITSEQLMESEINNHTIEETLENKNDEEPVKNKITLAEALASVDKLKNFFSNLPNVPDELFVRINNLEDDIVTSASETRIQNKDLMNIK